MKWLQIARYSFLSLAFCIDTLPPTVQRLPFNHPGRSGIIRKNALGDLHRSDLCNTVCQKSASTHLKPHHVSASLPQKGLAQQSANLSKLNFNTLTYPTRQTVIPTTVKVSVSKLFPRLPLLYTHRILAFYTCIETNRSNPIHDQSKSKPQTYKTH
ncbi:hypothetical protein M758_7G166800 [Ceratodon purpureus]|nr:hypothetical protein M758_7G166800 [Ceratodon purpureus]